MKTIDDGGKKKSGKLPAPLLKLKEMDPAARDRLVTRGITALVVCAVIVYALATMLPKNDPAAPGGPGSQAPGTASPQPGNADPYFEGAYGSQAPADYPPEPDYAIEPAGQDGNGYDQTGGKTLYAIGLDGRKKFEIRIPLGYGTFNSAGGTYVKPSDMDITADGNEPLYFAWASPSRYDALLEHGGIDFMEGREDSDRYEDSFRAIDYYTARDVDGNDIAVILARRSVKYKPDAEFILDDIEEYYIIADCGETLPFMGRISGYALDSGLSRRYPTLNAIARAMIQPASEPGFPEYWTKAEGMTAQADDPKYGEPGDGGPDVQDAPDAGDGSGSDTDGTGAAGEEPRE